MRRVSLLIVLATFVSQCGFAPEGDRSAVKSGEEDYYLTTKDIWASAEGDGSEGSLYARASETAMAKLDRKCGQGERIALCELEKKCYSNWFARGKTCHIKMKAWCVYDPEDNGIVGRYLDPAYWYNMKEIDPSACLDGTFKKSYGSNVPVKGEKVEIEEEEEEEVTRDIKRSWEEEVEEEYEEPQEIVIDYDTVKSWGEEEEEEE